ncbi:MAG: hypothetical protein KHX56_01070 [Clostridiales bacterium]|nr:hypothetical protein [Clostridiales bacterium]
MAYLEKDGNIKSDEAQDLHNRQLGELEERLNSIESELSYCAGINEALQSDQSFQEMIVQCRILLEQCKERLREHVIY